jgi:hypothetical protein
VKYGLDKSYAEREELERSRSTELILNGVAREAGVLHEGEAVHVTGHDRTYRQTKASQEPVIGPNAGTVKNGAEGTCKAIELLDMFIESPKLAVAAEWAGAIGVPLAAVSLLHDYNEAFTNGEERSEALQKDMMHIALVANLALPDGFRAAEAAMRPDATAGWQAPATKIAEKLALDPNAKAILQLRCDEGMHVALQYMQSGRPLDDFMKANEGFAKRFQLDAAFRAGFDAVVWSSEQGPKQLESSLHDLYARDARFHASANRIWSA